ncbi:DUF7009 family protein [Flagellimonas flava]|uniref:Uncharacterized protein n=1 Tax=Flagellimonas flava TaxID=570519 RepID=A0A1M5M2F1_9FLAO|nr:hypothetical protein [Allomuricauda flava]SHG71089.1 hypothetical protein SAMN04488116_2211 [Allomuricauda flava]
MKIRIRGNSVRYRLTRTEVETFCKEGSYSDETQFNTQTFIYRLVAKDGISGLEASFENNTITIYLPREETEVWAGSPRVGYENTFQLNNGEALNLLVEKDFVCMDETIEDQSDNYPNPKAL